MAAPDPAVAAVHRQAEKPGVANANGFARWDLRGDELELRRVCARARGAGVGESAIISALNTLLDDLGGQGSL